MAIHDVKYLSWHPVSKVLWVYVDGDKENTAALMCPTEEEIPSKIEEYVIELDRRDHDQPEVLPHKYSKIFLKLGIANLGKLPILEEWLSSFNIAPDYLAIKAWDDAQELSDDFEGFNDFVERAKSVLDITDEQAQQLLDGALIREE